MSINKPRASRQRAAVAKAIERCAKVCDASAKRWRGKARVWRCLDSGEPMASRADALAHEAETLARQIREGGER